MIDCSISQHKSALVVDGGHVSISNTKIFANIGGTAVIIGSTSTTSTEVSLSNCSIHSNENTGVNTDGGGLRFYGANTIAALDSCRIHSNRARFNGGGLSVQGAAVTMSRTIVRDNVAAVGATNNIDIQSSQLYYQLPTPPGYWLPSTMCIARREPCDDDASGDVCRATPCSTTSGNATNSWTPSNCKAPFVAQSCEWQTVACAADSLQCMLGHTVDRISTSVEVNLPYECSAGYVGSNESVHQGSSICAGACPAGFHCPTALTLEPIVCPVGYYCPVGTVNAITCPEGRLGPTPGLSKDHGYGRPEQPSAAARAPRSRPLGAQGGVHSCSHLLQRYWQEAAHMESQCLGH